MGAEDGGGRRPVRPGLGHRLEYLGVRVVEEGLRVFPPGLAVRLGSALGWFAGSVLRIRRRVVEENLRRAFPEASRRWRASVARGAYAHLGREGVSLLRFGDLTPEEVRRRTEVEGWSAFQAALQEGRGVILLTGHLGNWEVGGATLAARGIPLDVVAVRQKNPLFDARIVATREALGMRVVEKKQAPPRVLRALRDGRAVALVADQNVRQGGVFVDFFGTPASTARGPALFALRTGAPVFLGVAHRLRPGEEFYRLVLDRLDFEPTGDVEKDVGTLTQEYMAALEEAVRRTPEQYFWHHRRWKTRPGTQVTEALG